jgi:putative membrane protein (TIGR04086 family)
MKHKVTRKDKSSLKTILLSTVFSGAVLILIMLIMSFICYKTQDPVAPAGITSVLSLMLTAFISGFCITRYKGEGGVLCAVLSATLFVLILLLISLIIKGGKVSIYILLNYTCYVLISTLISFFASKKRTKRYSR